MFDWVLESMKVASIDKNYTNRVKSYTFCNDRYIIVLMNNSQITLLFIWTFADPSVSKIIFINWKSWCRAHVTLKEQPILPFIESYNETVLEPGGVHAVCALVKTIETVTVYTGLDLPVWNLLVTKLHV